MPVKNPMELFVMLLSNVRQNAERANNIYQELGKAAQDPDVKEVLEARTFLSDKIVATLDECFRLIGQQPVKLTGRLQEVFAEDFRREVSEIQHPVAKRLFVLAKIRNLAHLRIAEYETLIAAADISGNYEVGVLLESVLADKLALAERTRHLIRRTVESKIVEKLAA